MKTLKILSILVFAVFLVSTVAAFGDVYGEWEDQSQSMSIVNGESVDFNFDFFSMHAPMTININLYDSQSNLIYSFEDDTIITNPCTQNEEPISGTACYTGLETIDSSVYTSPGFYELIMTYSDADDYSKSHSLTLTVNALPNAIPVITLLGNNPETVVQGTTYADAGATAYDAEDGDITTNIVIVNNVDVDTIGTYTITYNVQDSAGNDADEVTRTVNVVAGTPDTIKPVITLLGNAIENVELGSTYTDAGATALDDIDGDITSDIVVVNPVDTNTVGVYTITYNVQDSAGNDADEVTRTVNVFDPNDTTSPTINVITPEKDKEYDNSELTFEIKVDEIAEVRFSLNGGSQITMDYQGISSGILTFVYDVDLNDGDYEVTFYATDAAGNTASVTVEFSIDTSESTKDDDKTYTNYYQSNYDEQLYLDQFKPNKIIYLEDDDVQPEKVLNWWQKFVAWLAKIFGFN